MAGKLQNRGSSTKNHSAPSSYSYTPSDYAELSQNLQNHVQMVTESLRGLAVSLPSSPPSPAILSDYIFVHIEPSQPNLTWDLPDDIWTDDLEDWLHNIPYFSVEAHPAPATKPAGTSHSSSSSSLSSSWRRNFPSFELPNLDSFIDDPYWQDHFQQESPSIYPQDEPDVSHPIGAAAQLLLQEAAEARPNYLSISDLFAIAPKIQAICAKIRSTVIKADGPLEIANEHDSDSGVSLINLNATPEVDSNHDSNYDVPSLYITAAPKIDADHGSNSEVSMLDLHTGPSLPIPNFYTVARLRGLTISTSGPPTINGDHLTPTSNTMLVRNHPISLNIQNRLYQIAATRGLTFQATPFLDRDRAPLTNGTRSKNSACK